MPPRVAALLGIFAPVTIGIIIDSRLSLWGAPGYPLVKRSIVFMAPKAKTSWQFQRHFRPNAYGWRSGPPLSRLRQALSELKQVARNDQVLAAEGAVRLIERLPPALEYTDDSSGSLRGGISQALELTAAFVSSADVDAQTRQDWLERLWTAYEQDERPWIEALGDLWGDLCGSELTAAQWAERLTPRPRPSQHAERIDYAYDRRTVAWLSASFRAGRHDAIVKALAEDQFWPHARWAVAALRARGETERALSRAEAATGRFGSVEALQICEELLLELGRRDEAWQRFALEAHESPSRVKWLKSLLKTYPEYDAGSILAQLVATSRGQEGRWFAAARNNGLLNEALLLAENSAAEPATLITALKQHADSDPPFAFGCGLLAVRGLLRGDAFDPDKIEIETLARHLKSVAEALDASMVLRDSVSELLQSHGQRANNRWAKILSSALL